MKITTIAVLLTATLGIWIATTGCSQAAAAQAVNNSDTYVCKLIDWMQKPDGLQSKKTTFNITVVANRLHPSHVIDVRIRDLHLPSQSKQRPVDRTERKLQEHVEQLTIQFERNSIGVIKQVRFIAAGKTYKYPTLLDACNKTDDPFGISTAASLLRNIVFALPEHHEHDKVFEITAQNQSKQSNNVNNHFFPKKYLAFIDPRNQTKWHYIGNISIIRELGSISIRGTYCGELTIEMGGENNAKLVFPHQHWQRWFAVGNPTETSMKEHSIVSSFTMMPKSVTGESKGAR